tara:strand:+ start:584 stop:838 length:255 start_codon:yes stop_codon:yes gene_type:complete
MSSPKHISFRNIDAFWSHDNELVFEGMTHYNELYNVSIPADEITDSLDYIIKNRIDYITSEKRRLNKEQRQLKEKLKIWKSLNI